MGQIIMNTERTSLRELTTDDLEFILELEARHESYVFEMEGKPGKGSVIQTCNSFMEAAKKLPKEGAVKLIVRNLNGDKMGTVSLHCNWEKTREWEIGYKFLKEYWGNGFASEAVRKVVNFAFYELHIHKLMAFINYENKNSIHLAKRIGMVQEGHMREARLLDGKWDDELVFSFLSTDL